MLIRDEKITRLIERIGEHYRVNVDSRFIRPTLLQLPLDKQTWDMIDSLTKKIEQYQYQGFDMNELYRQIMAVARFVSVVRREILPGLRNRLAGGGVTGSEKVLRDMAVNTFASNIQVFSDLINELYLTLVEIDKIAAKGRRPAYLSMPELQELGSLLVGS